MATNATAMVMNALGWPVWLFMLLSTLRRNLFLAASLLPRRRAARAPAASTVVLIAARNEADFLPRMLEALEKLDYPPDLLDFVFVNDGSTDATGGLIDAWAAGRSRVQVLHQRESVGKAQSLQNALAVAPASEFVAILDADTVPRPDALQLLVDALADAAVGAAGGYPQPGNSAATVASRYAAIERWTLHLVTLAGKDRLNMNPAAIGALCLIRRSALDEIGGFPVGTTAEDIHISLRLNRRGWRTRSVIEAVAREDVPEMLDDFRAQRLRWGRGLQETRGAASTAEDLFVAAGYVDRVVLIAAMPLAWFGVISWLSVGFFVAAPFASVLVAVVRARPPSPVVTLASIPLMMLADVGVTFASLWERGPIQWVRRRSAR